MSTLGALLPSSSLAHVEHLSLVRDLPIFTSARSSIHLRHACRSTMTFHSPSPSLYPVAFPCISRSMVRIQSPVSVCVRALVYIRSVYATVTHRPRIHFVLLVPPRAFAPFPHIPAVPRSVAGCARECAAQKELSHRISCARNGRRG